ncbi:MULTISPECIES: hypothetical protein [Grimontia]
MFYLSDLLFHVIGFS